jgi:hypothetical protein
MKRYIYKVEYNNKGLKTKFFDTRRQVSAFVKKHPQFNCSVFEKGMFGYNRIFSLNDF